jgi:hypothetical protein
MTWVSEGSQHPSNLKYEGYSSIKGRLRVSWGQDTANQCVAGYDLSQAKPISDSNGLRVLLATCHDEIK